jgi:hypothetical protein
VRIGKPAGTLKAPKGAKTDAILRLMEQHGALQPSVIAPQTGLCGKEVSSRISMLISQGRVKREIGDDGRGRVRFVSWTIAHLSDAPREPEPQQTWSVPEMWRCWRTPAEQALHDELLAVVNAGPTAPATNRNDQIDRKLASPFTQVIVRAVNEGWVRVVSHCMDDEPPRRRGKAAVKAASTEPTECAEHDDEAPQTALPTPPVAAIAKPAPPATVEPTKRERTVVRTTRQPLLQPAIIDAPPELVAQHVGRRATGEIRPDAARSRCNGRCSKSSADRTMIIPSRPRVL